MGRAASKPEFKTYLGDKIVKHGESVTLSCTVENPDRVYATWKLNDSTLHCVEGKHNAESSCKTFSLTINNTNKEDEGKYTVTVTNAGGSASCSAMVYVEFQNPWRTVKWGNSASMISELSEFEVSDKVEELNFLFYGRVGAGKSSTINTIKSIFATRQSVDCLANVSSSTSFTLCYDKHVIKNKDGGSLSYALFDMMGVENEQGVQTQDIINCMNGHVQEGYQFHPSAQINENSPYYISHPTLGQKIHCLLCVLPVNKVSMTGDEFIKKMKTVREAARSLGIPQVVLLTNVDSDKITSLNLQNVYKSKKIKEKMETCSNVLGVPVNCIFPVLNYHEQSHMNEDINCLMLDAMLHFIPWANDYVKKD